MMDASKALQEMQGRLNKAVESGYHVIAMQEILFADDMPKILHSDCLVESPDNLTTMTVLVEHTDHWHLYLFTLAKAAFDVTTKILTDRLLTSLQSAALDAQATVYGEAGRA